MQRSSDVPDDAGARTRQTGRQIDGAPVYAFAPRAGLPPVSVARLSELPWGRHPGMVGAHAHDFVTLVLVDQGDSELGVGGRVNRVLPGDLLIIAPGEVVTPGTAHPHHRADGVDGWVVFFDPHLLTGSSIIPPSWSRQPLLLPTGRGPSAAQHLHVPESRWRRGSRDSPACTRNWPSGGTASPRPRSRISCCCWSTSPGWPNAPAPPNGCVTSPCWQRFSPSSTSATRDQLSLRDVATAVALTPGHLSTVVGRRTGRTVQQWITERRMAEARTLLADSTAPVAAIARRVGYQDASYFIKHFRRAHQVTPGQWRDASR